ncbi:protein F14D2.9 [Elysia marginata]|uniref:Putative nuclease HARBI1 n=1 Tax=Elysia marginata TaxID=1093978 RepID=A0AAV4GFL0_9GAST|nr:protein F14D2.9 [Elysia marginata]
MIGVSQPTVSRTVKRVMDGFIQLLPNYIRPPTPREVVEQKILFSGKAGFPGVFACVDGTHVKILRPSEDEDVYVNRKNFHSINVQIVCDANLLILDCVARHPGSFLDARVLRESEFFAGMEQRPPVVDGLVLGDSGYPVRTWLMTPFGQPVGNQQMNFNNSHRQTRVTVERCIGVLKRRWHCLHTELRLTPAVASRVIYCCCLLHNKATSLGLDLNPLADLPADEEPPAAPAQVRNEGNTERARTAAGKALRLQIARANF